MTSSRCLYEKFWNFAEHKCQPCKSKYEIKAGSEFAENCGWSDDQQQIHSAYKPCENGTYNNGSHVKCHRCSSCITPFIACNSTSDTICCEQREQVFDGKCIPQPLQTTVKTTVSRTTATAAAASAGSSSTYLTPVSSQSQTQTPPHVINVTGIYVCLGILSTLTLVCLFLVIKRRRTRHLNEEFHKRNGAVRESLSKKGIKGYEQSVSYNIIKESDNNDHLTGSAYLLAPEIQGAPLKTVLNNLDVLEELVLVLDPDISGAKNTRHLAAQCSFSFAWINYAYSMKDHKSPLVAVLEGVVTKNPEWTVSHLAELLTAIGRNDAVEILAKLPAGAEE